MAELITDYSPLQSGRRKTAITWIIIISLVGLIMTLMTHADPPSVSVSTSSQLVSALKNSSNSGKTIEVTADLGNFTIDGARPASLITVVPGEGGGSLGTVMFTNNNSNIRFEGFVMRGVNINHGNSTNVNNTNLQFANCTAGGTESARIKPLAIFEIYGDADGILIDNCDIGWTDTNPTGGNDVGYGVRAIGGGGGRTVDNLMITRSKIHHTGCDNIQLGDVNDFVMDRTELAYAASAPGTDCHADSMQIMGTGGTNPRITNSWIHDMGYYSDTVTPSSSGQLIIHGWSGSTPWLIQNNLFTHNRNFTPEYKEESNGAFSNNWTWDHNTILSSFDVEGSGCSTHFGGSQAALTNNIIRNHCGSASYGSANGNVGIANTPNGGVRQANLTFDANYEPTNLTSGYEDAGYRLPTDVHWAPGATRIPGASTVAADTTDPTVSLTAPTNGATVSGTTSVTATASDDVAVSSVSFYVDGSSTAAATVSSEPYSYSWNTTALSNGSHTISAQATDTSGNTSTFSTATVTVSNADVTAPTAPSTFTAAAASSSQVNLSWSGATDNVGVTNYLIYRYVTSSGSGSASVIDTVGAVSSYSDTSVSANTGYTYYIVSRDAAGNLSSNSVTRAVTTPTPPDTTDPTTPTNATAIVASSNQVNLSWTASTDSGGSGLAGYNVYRNNVKLNSSLITSTSYGDATALPDTTYTYTIEAVDGADNTSSRASTTPTSVTTPPLDEEDDEAPTAPSSVRASTNAATVTTATTITVRWNASTDSGGSGLAGYRVYRNGALVATTASTSFTDYYLTPNTTYNYVVTAYDNSGNSTNSSSTPLATSGLIGDVDGDGKVTGHDLSLFLAAFGTHNVRYEFDGFPMVSTHNLSLLLSNYGK